MPRLRRDRSGPAVGIGVGLAAGTALAAMALAPLGAAAAMGTPSRPTVHEGHAARVGVVVVDPSGRTLYHLSAEGHGKIACTGGCASLWPPFVVRRGTHLERGAGMKEHLATIRRPDGTLQVTYGGWPLYTYSGDSSSGQANGQGIRADGGVWSATTPSSKVPASTAKHSTRSTSTHSARSAHASHSGGRHSTSTTSGSGYGY